MKETTVRIVSNGLCFKIQILQEHRFLWFRWDEWSDIGLISGTLPLSASTYYTLEEAKKVAYEVVTERTKHHDWEMVKVIGSRHWFPSRRDNSSASPGP